VVKGTTLSALGKEEGMRALLCHCRRHLEAEDDEALLCVVRNHLLREHLAVPPTDEQVSEIVATRAYYLEYAPVHVSGAAFEEEFGRDPY
jgi:hypothetical protein